MAEPETGLRTWRSTAASSHAMAAPEAMYGSMGWTASPRRTALPDGWTQLSTRSMSKSRHFRKFWDKEDTRKRYARKKKKERGGRHESLLFTRLMTKRLTHRLRVIHNLPHTWLPVRKPPDELLVVVNNQHRLPLLEGCVLHRPRRAAQHHVVDLAATYGVTDNMGAGAAPRGHPRLGNEIAEVGVFEDVLTGDEDPVGDVSRVDGREFMALELSPRFALDAYIISAMAFAAALP